MKALQLGRTIDDAAGEAFDKTGKILGLAYPGGRLLDTLARRGRADAKLFPRPYLDNDNLDFSYFDLTIPDAETESVRYDCGTYQMILAEVNYDCGVTLHVSAASRSASYDQIVALLQNVYPTGHTPETAE